MMGKRIAVVPYEARWEKDFLDLRDGIKKALGALAVGIEHAGSTAVKGLSAKPIIDIDAVIEDGTHLAEAIARLAEAGYRHEGDLGIAGREAFRYEGEKRLPEHHLYVCARDSAELRRHLAFRDFLRSHPEAAREYGRIKEKGAALYPFDADRYGRHKAPFVERIYREIGL